MVSVRKHLYLAGWIVDYLLNKKPLENAKTQNPLEARIDPDMDYYNIGAFTYIFSLLEEIKLQSYYLIIGGEEKHSKRQVEPLEKIRETFLKDDQIEKVENLNLFKEIFLCPYLLLHFLRPVLPCL